MDTLKRTDSPPPRNKAGDMTGKSSSSKICTCVFQHNAKGGTDRDWMWEKKHSIRSIWLHDNFSILFFLHGSLAGYLSDWVHVVHWQCHWVFTQVLSQKWVNLTGIEVLISRHNIYQILSGGTQSNFRISVAFLFFMTNHSTKITACHHHFEVLFFSCFVDSCAHMSAAWLNATLLHSCYRT